MGCLITLKKRQTQLKAMRLGNKIKYIHVGGSFFGPLARASIENGQYKGEKATVAKYFTEVFIVFYFCFLHERKNSPSSALRAQEPTHHSSC